MALAPHASGSIIGRLCTLPSSSSEFACLLSLSHLPAHFLSPTSLNFDHYVFPMRRKSRRINGLSSSSSYSFRGTTRQMQEKYFRIWTKADKLDAPILDNVTDNGQQIDEDMSKEPDQSEGGSCVSAASLPVSPTIEKDLKKVVNKAAATFAPRASTATKNPAVPGTALYTIFEVQGYASMFFGGVLSFNLIFPSNEPDIWRLMGMWSIWMFTIPSLRARDCSNKEKEALNYLFLLIPLLNVIIPFFLKSFAVVWSADTIAFFGMYAWKLGWLQNKE